jgi:hypothetical protein
MASDPIPPVIYTDVELESYLPAGWTLAEEGGDWDAAKGTFRCKVIDLCDLDWELAIPRTNVEKLGRIQALRRAVDELDRKRFESFL